MQLRPLDWVLLQYVYICEPNFKEVIELLAD